MPEDWAFRASRSIRMSLLLGFVFKHSMLREHEICYIQYWPSAGPHGLSAILDVTGEKVSIGARRVPS